MRFDRDFFNDFGRRPVNTEDRVAVTPRGYNLFRHRITESKDQPAIPLREMLMLLAIIPTFPIPAGWEACAKREDGDGCP